MKRLIPLFPLFFFGILAAVGLPPFGLWPVTLIAFAFFARRFQKIRRKRTAFWAGWLFAFGYFTAGLYWISNALLVNALQFWWAIPFALFGLPALLALFWGFFCIFVAPFTKQDSLHRTFTLALAIIFAEAARAYLFTGFPWNQLGLIWIHMPWITQSASIIGLEGLSILTILLGVSLFHYKHKVLVGSTVLAIVIPTVVSQSYSFDLKPADKTVVYVVQPNIAQKDKWVVEKIPEHLNKLITMTAQAEIDKSANQSIVVWPETALISNYFDNDGYRELIDDALQPYPNVTLVMGVLSTPDETHTGFGNSLYTYTQRGEIKQRYDKHHLVPFGEYIPFKDKLPLKSLVGIEGFVAGEKPTLISINEKAKLLPLICYEIIFPNYSFYEPKPNMIINITNDAWYGYSTGPFQHLAITQFRAIEQANPVIRSANTGISAVIDSKGRILESQSLNSEGIIKVVLPNRSGEQTIYALYGKKILLIMILMLFFSVCALRYQKRT